MRNVAIIVAAVVVLTGGFLIAKNDSEESQEASAAPTATEAPVAGTPAATVTSTASSAPAPEPAAPRIPVVRVVDGKPQGGVQDLKFGKGDRIRFTIVSDTADEIHVHGFDLYEDLPAGGRVTLDFTGDADGRYEVELHGAGEPIAELQIAP